jgi:hypothetical protein
MFTETILHEHPEIIKAFMGIPSKVFWEIVEIAISKLPEFDSERLDRPDRQRKSGAGRDCDQPIALRVAAMLTYLRLHAPPIAIAMMYGMTQPDISRDLRRILPVIQSVLPCPQVWKILESAEQALEPAEKLETSALG